MRSSSSRGYEDVLVRDRNSGERRRFPAGAPGIGRGGLRQRDLRTDIEKGIESAMPLDAVEVGPRQLGRGSTPACEGPRQLGERRVRQFAHRLLDDLGHQKEPVLPLRRVLQVLMAPVSLSDDVVAQPLTPSERVRHRLDSGRIDGTHALDHREDVRELRKRALGLGVGDLDACQVGDATDLFEVESHLRCREGAPGGCRLKALEKASKNKLLRGEPLDV